MQPAAAEERNGRHDEHAILRSTWDHLAGAIWQRADMHQIYGRTDRISDGLKHFYRELGRHEKAIDILEPK